MRAGGTFIRVVLSFPFRFIEVRHQECRDQRLMGLQAGSRSSPGTTLSPRPGGREPPWDTLTLTTGAHVLDAGLEARAETFVGWVDRPVGKQSFGGYEAIRGDAFKHP